MMAATAVLKIEARSFQRRTRILHRDRVAEELLVVEVKASCSCRP
jgi:hypothetical protein